MRNKLIIWALMLASTVIFLPAANYAAAENPSSVTVNEFAPQVIRVQTNRRRGRNWNRGRSMNRGRHLGWRNQRTRLVKRTYWINGRRYVRYVRVRY